MTIDTMPSKQCSPTPHTFELVTKIILSRKLENDDTRPPAIIIPTDDCKEEGITTAESRGCYQSGSDDESKFFLLTPSDTMSPTFASPSRDDIMFKEPCSPEEENQQKDENYRISPTEDNNQRFLNMRNVDGLTPLLIASQNCNLSAIKILVSNGADVNAQDELDRHSLHRACAGSYRAEQLDTVRFLIENNANVNAQDIQGKTPLHIAAQGGCYECVCLLLSSGACCRLPDLDGNSALHIAVNTNYLDVIEVLSTSKLCSRECLHCTSQQSRQGANGTNIMHYRPEKLQELIECGNGTDNSETQRCSEQLTHQEHALQNEKNLEIWNRFFENCITSNVNDANRITKCSDTMERSSMSGRLHRIPNNSGDSALTAQTGFTDRNLSISSLSQQSRFEDIGSFSSTSGKDNIENLEVCIENKINRGRESFHLLQVPNSAKDEDGSSLLSTDSDHIISNDIAESDSLWFHLSRWMWRSLLLTLRRAREMIFPKRRQFDHGASMKVPEDVRIALAKVQPSSTPTKLVPPEDVMHELQRVGLR